MGLRVGMVHLDEYNPKWEEEFLLEKGNLKELFGDVAKSIDHIGSTAVKGLSAKPIIDIAVCVESLMDFDKVKCKFVLNPVYSVKEDSTPGEILIIKGSEKNTTHLIHVMEIQGERYLNTILFRDYLRNHPESVREYQRLKEELAIKYYNNRPKYTEAKAVFICDILSKARKEFNI